MATSKIVLYEDWRWNEEFTKKYRYVTLMSGQRGIQYDSEGSPCFILTSISQTADSDVGTSYGQRPRYTPDTYSQDVARRNFQSSSGDTFESYGSPPRRSSSLQGQPGQHQSISAPLNPARAFDNASYMQGPSINSNYGLEQDRQQQSNLTFRQQNHDSLDELGSRFSSLDLQSQGTESQSFLKTTQLQFSNLKRNTIGENNESWYIPISCEGRPFTAKVDPTATYSVVKRTFPGHLLEATEQITSQACTALEGRVNLPAGIKFYNLAYSYGQLLTPITEYVVLSYADFASCDVIFGRNWKRQHGEKFRSCHDQSVVGSWQPNTNAHPQPMLRHPLTYGNTHGVSTFPPIDEDVEVNEFSRIKGTKGTTEPLDKRYSIKSNPRSFFRSGKVFALLWHENTGSNGTEMTNGNFTRGRFGQNIYSSIRRMVVVREYEGYCWCCPITTYSGQGVAKHGLPLNVIKNHSIVYITGTSPARKSNEVGMTKRPIRIQPSTPREKLHQMSRLNFGKIYTVEHNVKVKDVGRVADGSMVDFRGYVHNVMTNSGDS